MKLDPFVIAMSARRSGKTTAICKAAKEIGAIVICHSKQEANRVAREHQVKTVHLNSEIRGMTEPFLIDTYAYVETLSSFHTQLEQLQEQLKRLDKERLEWKRLAKSWMDNFDQIKNKYEPLISKVDDESY